MSLGHALDREIFGSIAEKLDEVAPEAHFTTLDLLEYVKPSIKQMVWDRLSSVADYIPGKVIDLSTLLEPDLETLVGQLASDRLVDDLMNERPDVLLGVHPLTQQAMTGLSIRLLRDTALVTLIPEYCVDHAWVRHRSDLYLVASGALREALVDLGVPLAQSAAVGLPLSKRYAAVEREPLRREFGVGEGERLILVTSRELDEALMEKMLFQLSLVNAPKRVIVATDGDKRSAQFLRDKAPNYSVKAQLYHKTEKLSALYAAADVVVGRPQALKVAEILSRGVPVFWLEAESEHDRATAAILAAESAGKSVDNAYTLAAELDALFRDSTLADRLRRGALELARPDATREIAARLVRAATDEKERLIARRIEQGRGRSVTSEDEFEEIGDFAASDHADTSWTAQERHEHLSAAIRHAKTLEQRLREQQASLSKWEKRLILARQHKRPDLVQEADVRIDTYKRTIAFLESQIEIAQKTREQIKAGHVVGSPYTKSPLNWERSKEEDLERTFRGMEVESDLDALKRKLDG
ncbi:MAG: hypothetical protein KC609_25460 [Myxococcales bacterium]|nr:hypothetical protein [Myxococcales bacterium]